MEYVNAVLIDVSTLNTLIIYRGRIVTALNYDKNLEQLSKDLMCFDDFDLYLVLSPMLSGEGDIEIKTLSTAKLPFIASYDELCDLCRFARSTRASSVHFVNGLASFVSFSRMPTFKAAFTYGNRCAVVSVKDREIAELQLYADKQELYNLYPDVSKLYGDLEICDVDRIKALYPELKEFKRLEIVPVANLISAYNSIYTVPAEEVYNLLDKDDVPEIQEIAEEAPEEPKYVHLEPEPAADISDEPDVVSHKSVKAPVRKKGKINPILAVFNVLLAVAVGAGVAMTSVDAKIEENAAAMAALEVDQVAFATLENSFEYSSHAVTEPNRAFGSVYKSIKSLSTTATIVGLELKGDEYTLHVYLKDTADGQALCQQIGTMFEIVSDKSMGTVNMNNGTLTDYYVTFK